MSESERAGTGEALQRIVDNTYAMDFKPPGSTFVDHTHDLVMIMPDGSSSRLTVTDRLAIPPNIILGEE